MLGHSLPEYVFIRTCILALRLIAPLSGMYLCASGRLGYWLWSRWLGYYAAAEVAFYLGVYLPRSFFMQQAAQHPTPFTRAEREALFAKCFATMRDAELATGWFHFSEPDTIRRDNVVEWVLWALFSSSRDAYLDEWKEEIESYVKAVERLLGRKLEEGMNDRVKCMKVTLDPVIACHRPLLWYIIVSIVDSITAVLLSYRGFRHYTLWSWYRYFPPRLLSLFSEPSPHPRISYWYRPHRSTTKHPILFIHGIGIGLWPYTPFLAEIVVRDPDVGIIAVENLPISMRISPPPMTRAEMLEALAAVLRAHAFESYVVCGHSYGTVVAAHMMREPTFSARVAGWILVDPIPFLLHQPSVAYNFVYREPKTANEWQLWYFASRDPDIARALARNFFWAENILWKDDLKGRKVGVSLVERDQIVDAESVRKYLTDEDTPSDLWVSEDKQLEVLWYRDLDHAQVFDDHAPRKLLDDVLARFLEKVDMKPASPYCE
ncbi:Alpha/Beta hydrolase protein [Cytidiella melzeri]|nr:Alpha/Beta hydrolase protein [Cytidiella melzeri]